jgi:hypothetical protein
MPDLFHSDILLRLAIVIALFMTGCQDDYVSPQNPPLRYFPMEEGFYRIYDVDSIVHAENDNNNDDSVYSYHFQVMEIIDSSYIDPVGDSIRIVVRYHRPDSVSAWSLTSVWTQTVNRLGAYRTEENIRYHKLALPLLSSTVWDANASNTLAEELCYYDYIDQPDYYGAFTFDSTVAVFQRDEDNFVERKYGREVYAAGVGLVFKEREDLGKRNGFIVRGLEFRMTIVDYGTR